MISTIRKNFKRSAVQVIVFITIVSMLGADFLRRKMGKSQDLTVAATVNGYDIPMKVFKARVREEERILSFFKSQFGENADIILKSQGLGTNPQENVMKNMIRDALLDSAADKIGINLSSSYVSKKLTDPKTIYSILNKLFPTLGISQAMKIDSVQLASFLKRDGLTVSEFEAILEDEVKRSYLLDVLASAVYVPKFVIEEKFSISNQDRKFAILDLKLEDYINKLKATKIYDNQAKEYYDIQNKKSKKYWAPEKRFGNLWTFKPEDYGLNVAEKDLKDKFKRLFELDAKRVTQSGAGLDSDKFKEFVKNKKCVESKLENIESNSSLQSRAIFSIKPNQKIYYLENNKGYILELAKIIPSHQIEFEKIKSTVINDLYSEKAFELLIKDLERYNNELKYKTLEDVAKEYQVAMNIPAAKNIIEKTDWLNEKTAEKYPGFEKRNIDVSAILQMTKKGSHIAYPGKNNGYIIQVTDTKPLDYETLEKSKSDIYSNASQEMLQQIMYSFIASLSKNGKISYNPSFNSAT